MLGAWDGAAAHNAGKDINKVGCVNHARVCDTNGNRPSRIEVHYGVVLMGNSMSGFTSAIAAGLGPKNPAPWLDGVVYKIRG